MLRTASNVVPWYLYRTSTRQARGDQRPGTAIRNLEERYLVSRWCVWCVWVCVWGSRHLQRKGSKPTSKPRRPRRGGRRSWACSCWRARGPWLVVERVCFPGATTTVRYVHAVLPYIFSRLSRLSRLSRVSKRRWGTFKPSSSQVKSCRPVSSWASEAYGSYGLYESCGWCYGSHGSHCMDGSYPALQC